MKTKIYIVNAYRWGNRENHSYTLGAFTDQQKAIDCAESHTTYRGGKYSCVVEMCTLNEFSDEMDDYTTEIYSTKSL